jgi:catechol 2,3-dioxygenase-like lactoylglutathione lyase family enzyme
MRAQRECLQKAKPDKPAKQLNMSPYLILFLAAVIVFFIRSLAGGMDRGRVEEYLRRRGAKLISASGEPLGKGWLGVKSDRIYRVLYVDAEGQERSAICRSSIWSGVYFTEDQPVRLAKMGATVMRDLPTSPPEGQSFFIHGLDHVQLAMPPGEEEAARRFYRDLLGLQEIPKPANLAARGGVWFAGGTLRLHLGVEGNFSPARKAHPALLVQNLPALIAHLEREGVPFATEEPLEGYRRIYTADPFGNRVELLEPA